MMKRILHVLSGNKTFSGVASYLYQQYKLIDRSKVIYDFFLCKENSMELVMDDSIFKESKFYVINARTKKTKSTNYLIISKELDNILSNTHYDAVVVNTSIVMIIYTCLKVVKKHKDVRFIAHAHNTGLVLNKGSLRGKIGPLMQPIDNMLRSRIRKDSYALFGCSVDAGVTTFGKETAYLDKFRVIFDAIDLNKFRYNKEISEEIRHELSVDNTTFIIGNVGKLAKRKNQKFLIDIFNKIHEVNSDSELWLIGEGEDRPMLEKYAAELGLGAEVRLLGEKKDVNRYFQAMNVFVFTTISEGLGIVAIEAQAAGLPTIVSDGVPDDVLLTPLALKMGLSKSSEEWANKIIELWDDYPGHPDYTDTLKEAGYDIITETENMTDYYSSLD